MGDTHKAPIMADLLAGPTAPLTKAFCLLRLAVLTSRLVD